MQWNLTNPAVFTNIPRNEEKEYESIGNNYKFSLIYQIGACSKKQQTESYWQ